MERSYKWDQFGSSSQDRVYIEDGCQLSLQKSSIPASDELAADLKSAKSDGKKMVQKFMDERVFLKKKLTE